MTDGSKAKLFVNKYDNMTITFKKHGGVVETDDKAAAQKILNTMKVSMHDIDIKSRKKVNLILRKKK